MYEYMAYVTKVYDGDTITCNVSCGFGISLQKQKIRLANINAPEMRGAQREEAVKSRDALASKILNNNIILQTNKDKKGKYGRYIGTIIKDGVNINNWMLENNYAVKYGKK